MLRLLAVIAAALALALAASYTPLLAATPVEGDPPVSLAPEPTPAPAPPAVPPSAQASRALWRELPLEALSPEAVDFLGQRAGSVGVAVIVPEKHAIYTANGHERFHLASVAKVLIMLTLLDKAAAEGRDLTAEEMEHLEPMIVLSSNDDADALWSSVGGAEAVKGYLASHSLRETEPDEEGYWGETEASPEDVAQLLAGLIESEGIDEQYRSVAVGLMLQAVDWSGGWGAVSGLPEHPALKVYTGAKDGWYPADEGWWVTSAGFILPDHARPPYALAILTNGQPSVEYGATTVHEIAAHIHEQMMR